MSNRSTRRESGFSLLEMTIAMALGTLVLGAAVQLYSQGVAATWTVQQRAEMQQDFRAASNMMLKDLSLAGAGLPNAAAMLFRRQSLRFMDAISPALAISVFPIPRVGNIPNRAAYPTFTV